MPPTAPTERVGLNGFGGSPTLCRASLALGLTFVLSLSPGMGHWAGRLMSEPLFTFLVMLSLWALRGHPERTARFVFSSAMAIIAALVRTAGVAGLIGLFGYWLWRRQWARAAILAMLSAITVGTWIGWTVLAPGEAGPRSYVDQFIQNTAPTATRKSASTAPSRWAPAVAKVGGRVVRTANEFLTRTIPSTLSVPTVPGTVIDNVGWAVIVVLALSVGTAALGRAWLPAAVYLVAYGAMLMVWPFVPPRFLIPVIPLLMLSVFLMALRMARGRAPENRVILVLVVVLTVGQIMGLRREYRDSYGCQPEEMIRGRCINSAERAMLRLTDWLKDSVPADTRLMSTKERPV